MPFVGTAIWTYLTQPFTFALPGFETTELERWQETGERWRRLHVVWPSYLATHSTEQTLYFGSAATSSESHDQVSAIVETAILQSGQTVLKGVHYGL